MNEEETCAACTEAGEECTSTLPRKRRAPLPQPSLRYASLDAIVRKLYPDEEIDTMAGLSGLAERLGVEISKETTEGDGTGETEHPSPAHHPSSFENPELPPEGYLVPAPRGGHHYVGPASLVYFAKCARHLVARSSTLKKPAFDEQGLRRYRQAAAFATYKVSHTIEANIQGHPATFAASHEQSPSFSFPIDSRSGPSPGGDAFRQARLPNRITGDALVQAFFDRVHRNFPVLHQAAFQVLYEAAYDDIDHATDPGKACTLYMVFTLGAQALEDRLSDAQVIQQKYLSMVIREGLGRLILTSTLANVQALLLLSLYQHNAGERNTAWILIGQAIRAAVSSGLHRDGENCDFDPFERNIRRLVWWTLHIFEQTVSLALGRPSFSDVIIVNARFPDTPFEIGIGLPAQYLQHYVALSNFMVRIKKLNAILSVRYQEPQKLVEKYHNVMAVHAEVISLKKSLPKSLSLGQAFSDPKTKRLVLLLIIWADYLESVLCRPYLLARVHQDLDGAARPPEIDHVAELSVAAAHASATKLLILADNDILESSVWLDFYCAQHAIMIISLHFLGQPDPSEWDDMRDTVSRLIAIAQSMNLAPTYRITMNVALQLSCIAGIGPGFSVNLPPTALALSSNSPEPPPEINPLPFRTQNTTMGPSNPLDSMFGPLSYPIHQIDAEPAMYSDLYNLGLAGDDVTDWDFFGNGSFLLQGNPGEQSGDSLAMNGQNYSAGDLRHGGTMYNSDTM